MCNSVRTGSGCQLRNFLLNCRITVLSSTMSKGLFFPKNATSNIVNTLKISPRILNAAQRAGCVSAWNVLCIPESELRQRTGLSDGEIEILISEVIGQIIPKQVSAWELLKDESKSVLNITMGCYHLDKFLGGGIPLSGITEITGESGSGKTQLTLQLALQAQLPREAGGLGKGVAYICTESQFPTVRLHQLIGCMKEKYPESLRSYTDHIYVHHVPDMDSLVDCVSYQLPLLISKHQVGLVIIDSIAAVFRVEDGKEVNKSQTLQALGYKLHQLAVQRNVAVITINQIAASFGKNNFCDMKRNVTPALGLSWANLVTTRLMLSRTMSFITSYQIVPLNTDQEISQDRGEKKNYRPVKYHLRTLEVIFCPWIARKSTSFVITNNGIEDIDPNSPEVQVSHEI